YSVFFFFSSRRRHTRCYRDWSSDVCSSDLSGAEAAPFSDQIFPQLDIVENFSVKDDGKRLVFVVHGLLAGPQIYDAQPCMREARPFIRVNAEIIRATMPDPFDHPDEKNGVCTFFAEI